MGTHESKTSELAFREEKVSDQAQRQGCSAVMLQSFHAAELSYKNSEARRLCQGPRKKRLQQKA